MPRSSSTPQDQPQSATPSSNDCRRTTKFVVGNKFVAGPKLDSGSFGHVFLGMNVETGEEVAIKLESIASHRSRIMVEAAYLKALAGGDGVAGVHWVGVEGKFNAIVLDLLGPSLEDLFNFCRRRFSLKTVLMLADQMIERVRYVHAHHIIHRDIKPENFVIGLGRKADEVHLIDFGLAKQYRDLETLQHMPRRENRALVGTAKYVSVSTHAGVEQSRRDDLEALGYLLVYLRRGSLPWDGRAGSKRSDMHRMIAKKKSDTPIELLCEQLPGELATYLSYCRRLGFEECPDYAYLRRLLKELFVREGYQYDFIFDWTVVNDALDERSKGAERLASEPDA